MSRAVNQLLYVLCAKVELFFCFLEDLGNQPRIARISRIEERGISVGYPVDPPEVAWLSPITSRAPRERTRGRSLTPASALRRIKSKKCSIPAAAATPPFTEEEETGE